MVEHRGLENALHIQMRKPCVTISKTDYSGGPDEQGPTHSFLSWPATI